MPVYNFTAKNLKGEEIEDSREAVDEFALAKDLNKDNFILVDFRVEGKLAGWRAKLWRGKFDFSTINIGNVPYVEKIIFTRNLAVMMKAGLSVSRSMKVLIEQAKNKHFKRVLTDMSQDVVKGKSLSDAMSGHEKVFPQIYTSMVKAGEKSGKLHESLKLLAEQMEKSHTLKRKIRGAMIYPAIIIIAMVGIGILMLVYVVPGLVLTFEELGTELPVSTKIIIWLSGSLIANSLIILSSLAFVIFSLFFLIRYPSVNRVKDKLFLHLPLISPLIRKINSARTARTLSSLIDSGVEILEALEITSEVLQNVLYKDVIKAAKEKIQKGASISSAFKDARNEYSPLLAEMIMVGEETGKLSSMLSEVADFYEEEVSQITKNMATIVEPVLMIIVGVAVGFFAISMIKPMYTVMEGL